ncbi:MAG: lipocalin [Bacteroidetes bacterium]|nr:lipocalin [Bacteroidota bacterium]
MGFNSCAQKENNINMTTIKDFDINRYLGLWFEIGRFDHSFERGMVGTTAMYSLNEDGTIKVVNSGYKDSFQGKFKRAIGKAKPADKNNPAKLKVSFFLWFYGEYNILELDKENYSYALIGSSSDKYLWILSRSPKLSDDVLEFLIKRAKERGYDTSKIIWVDQSKNINFENN